MTIKRVESLFPSALKKEEELCKYNSYWIDRTFSNKKQYKMITYNESSENSGRFARAIIYFDSDDLIIGLDYASSGYPALGKEDLQKWEGSVSDSH